jgi:prefoldin subunit 5
MRQLNSMLLIFVLSWLTIACGENSSPEQTAQQFWQAIINNDLEKADTFYSSDSARNFTALNNTDQSLKSVTIAPATVNANNAEVATTLISNLNGKYQEYQFSTHLVKENAQWKVNDTNTVNALVSKNLEDAVAQLTNDFSSLGNALNESIATGLNEFLAEFSKAVPNIKQDLEKLTDKDQAKQLGQSLGNLFSQGLTEAMKELNSSMEQLSKEIENANKELESMQKQPNNNPVEQL